MLDKTGCLGACWWRSVMGQDAKGMKRRDRNRSETRRRPEQTERYLLLFKYLLFASYFISFFCGYRFVCLQFCCDPIVNLCWRNVRPDSTTGTERDRRSITRFRWNVIIACLPFFVWLFATFTAVPMAWRQWEHWMRDWAVIATCWFSINFLRLNLEQCRRVMSWPGVHT